MKITHAKRTVLCASLVFSGFVSASPQLVARSTSGIAVNSMVSSSSISLTDLIAKAKVSGVTTEHQDKKKTPELSEGPAISVAELTGKNSVALSELVELAQNPHKHKIKNGPVEENLVSNESQVISVADPKIGAIVHASVSDIASPVVSIIQDGNTYKVTPERLLLSSVGTVATVKITGTMPGDLALFVRDGQIAEFSKSGLSIEARSAGATELYIVAGGKMNIVPLTVKAAERPFELKVPDTLLSLDGIVHGGSASALYPGIEKLSVAETSLQADALNEFPTELAIASVDDSLSVNDLSVFHHERAAAQYHELKIKVVDDRTPLDSKAEGRAFPAAGVEIQVVGTRYSAKTDATGIARIKEAPKDARLLLRVKDPQSVYRPAVVEVTTGNAQQTVRLMRNFSFDGFSEMVQSAQHAALGSYCLRIVEANTKQSLSGHTVEMDARGEGPYYFNSYGFIDRAVSATGADGRVCAFNVEPGPVAISLFDGEYLVATITKGIFSGYHLEDTVAVGGNSVIQVKLAALAPASVQLNADVKTANQYIPVEYADVTPFGYADPMTFVGYGHLESKDPVTFYDGRLRLAVQTADFEPSIYSIPSSYQQVPVLALVPRGFIEDMAVYAQVTYESTLGSVLVEYNHHESVRNESIAVRLIDHNNDSRGEGWYFSDRPLTKALFFNVPAGIYQLQAETSDGYWLTSQVVYVYDENMTYVRLGGAIRTGQKQ